MPSDLSRCYYFLSLYSDWISIEINRWSSDSLEDFSHGTFHEGRGGKPGLTRFAK
ncbi:hypothetical protein PM8797T_31578 [Gimesia maris DSM 8797]|nr:hypothetical protein PM8797T_31578 [Gimesia maris DSM 8797]